MDSQQQTAQAWTAASAPGQALNLIQLLRQRAQSQPHARAYTFLSSDLAVVATVEYAQLREQALALAAYIATHARPGDRVLLAYPPGLEVVVAFWACLHAGVVAVPAPSPDAAKISNGLERLSLLARDCGARVALTTRQVRDAMQRRPSAGDAASLAWLATDDVTVVGTASAGCAGAPATELAYLQYSSGSTSTPRGVMISHANVLANCDAMMKAGRPGAGDRVLSWLPYFHDYGLVQGILLPVYAGLEAFLMSPQSFMRRPLRWLEALASFGITHTGAPNFAYAACIEALYKSPGWKADLSGVKMMSCGAEPIDPETTRRFIDLFGIHGMHPHTFAPAYGLAEATLTATLKPVSSEPALLRVDADALENDQLKAVDDASEHTRVLVGCGKPVGDMAVSIVDPVARTLVTDGRIGEVWLSGSSIGAGYWGNPEGSLAAFGHTLDGVAQSRWLRTGDLGAMHGDELFVTGRLKDLMIVRGRNYYPHDIERTVEQAHPALRRGHAAAFTVDSAQGEQIVVVQELSRQSQQADPAPIVHAIRRAVAHAHELPLHAVALIRPGSIPRTSSGKIRRQACRQDFLAGQLALLHLDRGTAHTVQQDEMPRTEVEQALCDIWSEVLQLDQVGIADNFFELGGHSLLATQVASRIRERLKVELPLRELFEAPTVATLARRIELLPPDHQEPAIQPTTRDAPLQVSFSQRRMWLVQQLDPRATAYNMPFALRLRGTFDVEAFASALRALSRRHEAFRTSFAVAAGEPVQVIAPCDASAPLPLTFLDYSGVPPKQRIADTERLFRTQCLEPFDLARGPLFRVFVVRFAPDEHAILWVVHHAVADQWSAGVMSRDLAAFYRAEVRHQHFEPPPLVVQYGDYAVWQRRHLGGVALEVQLAYWRERLQDLSPLVLPTDRPRPARQTYRGSYVRAELAPATLKGIRNLGARNGATPFMTLLACFKLLLARHSGQQDIAVGSPIANRTRTATENLIGTLVNTLVMRTSTTGDPTFEQLLTRVRETALGAFAHQDMPFERLVEELGGAREAGHAPLVQVLFNVPNAPVTDLDIDGLEVEPFEFDHGSAQFDLSMSIDTERFGRAYLSYSTDLFDAATAQGLLDRFVGLIDQVIADPARPIGQYRLPTPTEFRHTVIDWNATAQPIPALRTDEMVAAQAQRTPDAVAVGMGEARLSYAGLDNRINRLAHFLRQRGFGPGKLAGVCLERSPDAVVALLAIMRAGGAYVPLDPALPVERLALMVQDAGLSLLLTQSHLLQQLPPLPDRVICVDQAREEIAAQPDAAPTDARTAQERSAALAYVLYTSGSTGTPKGVEIGHRALTNFLCSMRASPGCSQSDVLLAVTTLSFDISGLELYLPLICGARVELASRQQAVDARLLMELIQKVRPTIMQATPPTWRMLCDAGWIGDPGITALCGGDSLPGDLAQRMARQCSAFWNLYGPTETTIWSTAARIRDADVHIGGPIANTTVYVLDAGLQPLPVGVPGELYIGGEGLAHGYRNRAGLTQEKFIPDPFSSVPGSRLYRTGDQVRWRSDGNLVHLGRLDHQVKIRGFRIELGEIETVLTRHPAIAQAVVMARPDHSGIQQLVAYATLHQDQARPAPAQLRDHLRQVLPDYMLPAQYVFLDTLPFTANNKIDRKALPEPADDDSSRRTAARQEPQSPLEVQLTALWRHVLGVDAGVNDNFFDLGGHSLKAVQLISCIRDACGRDLPLAALFEAPTIRKLAELIEASGWKASWRSLVAIQPSGSKVPIFAVPGVGGNVLVFGKLARLLGPDQPFYGLQARGLDGTEKPFASVVEAATHYVAEIRSVRPRGPYLIGGTCTGGVFAFEIARQLLQEGETVRLMLMESWHPSSYRLPGVLAMALWPVRFLGSKLASYISALASMPVSQWPEFFRSKANAVGSTLRAAGGTEAGVPQISEFQVQRVVKATMRAVARYDARNFPGHLLNVIAANRKVAERWTDTRRAWESLARSAEDTVAIAAENSGRLFVSPHVEVLAAQVAAFASALPGTAERRRRPRMPWKKRIAEQPDQ